MDNNGKQIKNLFAQAQDILNTASKEGRKLTDEEKSTYKKYYDDIVGIKEVVEENKRLEDLGRKDAEVLYDGNGKNTGYNKGEARATKDQALEKWIREGDYSLTADERKILGTHEDPNARGTAVRIAGDFTGIGFTKKQLETRATNSAVANPTYAEDTLLHNQLVTAQKHYGGWIEQVATIIRTKNANTFYIPTNDDTGNTGALETYGTDAIASTTDVTLAREQLDGYWFSSGGLVVGWDNLRDWDLPLEQLIYKPLATRYWRAINTYATTGTGSSQPEGVEIGAAIGEIISASTIPDQDDLTAALKDIDHAYTLSPSYGWMMHKNTVWDIASQVKSSTYNNEPLWQPSLAAGVPDKLYGIPYYINNDMDQIGANKYPLLLGDFSYFWVRFVGEPTLIRLNERYAEKGQVGFLLSGTMDSVVADPNASTQAPIVKLRNLGT